MGALDDTLALEQRGNDDQDQARFPFPIKGRGVLDKPLPMLLRHPSSLAVFRTTCV